MPTKKKTQPQKAHAYEHEYPPQAWVQKKLANLENTRDGLLRLLIMLKLTCRQYGRTALKDRLPGQPANMPPPQIDGARNRVVFEDGSTWSLKRVLEAVVGEEHLESFLRTVRVGDPQSQRFFVFEAGDIEDPHRSVSDNPHEALAELHIPTGSKVRGVVVDCPPDLSLAKQLAGQQGTRRKFNWCEDVPLDRDGRLADVRWHGHWLTPLEQLLLKEQLGIERVAKVRRLRRESMMRQAETDWT